MPCGGEEAIKAVIFSFLFYLNVALVGLVVAPAVGLIEHTLLGFLKVQAISFIITIPMYAVAVKLIKPSSNGLNAVNNYGYARSINELRRSLSKMLVNTADGSLPSYEEIDELERALNRIRELKRELEFG